MDEIVQIDHYYIGYRVGACGTTLFMVFSATCCLELRNAITIY